MQMVQKLSVMTIVICRYLRKEKEIAEARLEMVQAEANRKNQQNVYLEKQLNDTSKALSEEREQAQVGGIRLKITWNCIVCPEHTT